ncbi:MAG: 50S ribosomal protein L17 [Prevotellaceae bacterium]|jgi:large subunit ribosomal protein L17|nr:50S ribosomal protein L17 [Prevotellaceae bacterium]
MRHNRKFNHLGRTASHRSAMLANMACSLIKHKRISTTVAKAKALRIFVEPLITKAKDDTMHSRRVVFSNLKDKYAVTELFREISVKVADRPGGYTRILKTGHRLGDAADMCFIELVDYNTTYIKEDKKSTKKTTRRAGKKASEKTNTEPVVKETVKEITAEVKEEVVETPEVETVEVETAPEVAETEEPKAE